MKVYLNSLPEFGIYIISDRQKEIVEYFQHHRIVAGTYVSIPIESEGTFSSITWDEILITSQKSQVVQENCFISYPSHNDDGSGEMNSFGLQFNLAPVSLDVIQLWESRPQPDVVPKTILLERDPEDLKLYHFLGWAQFEHFFFSSAKSLWYQGK